MIFGDNLDAFVVEEDEILYIVEQTLFAEKTDNQVGDAQTVLFNLFAVYLFFLIVHPQPLEEKFISGIPSSDFRLQTV